MNLQRYREIIHSYILTFRSHFFDSHIRHPNYDLVYTLDEESGYFNSAVNINLDSDSIDSEIKQIEKYFKVRQKDSTIIVEPSSKPKNLEEILIKKDYKYNPKKDVYIWIKQLPLSESSFNNKIRFVIVSDFDTFQDYLQVAKEAWNDVFDYSRYAASLSKLYNKPSDGVRSMHIVGYLGDKAVCSSTLGVYFDIAHLLNISVTAKHRRQGIASEMIRYAALKAKEIDSTELCVCIDKNDKPGTNLLKNLSFSPEILQKIYTKKL